jgi:hypothetical protein
MQALVHREPGMQRPLGMVLQRGGSGSCSSAIEVDPTRSANSTVASFRSSCTSSPGSRAAQFEQNLARSGFSAPQFGQTVDTGASSARMKVRYASI